MPRPSGALASSRPPPCSSTIGPITSPPRAPAAGGASCTAATTARSPPCGTSRSRAEGLIRDPGHFRDPAAHGLERLHDLRLVRTPEEWCGIFRVPLAGRPMKNEVLAEPPTAIHAQVIAAREGRDPRVIARLFSGWAVFGERQFVRGYAVLLPDPVVPNLNALGVRERIAFLSDMSRLGDALLKVTGALRINYAIFGNQEAALHAHVIPR